MPAKVELSEGASILFPEGPRVVVGFTPAGCVVRTMDGHRRETNWADIGMARPIDAGRVDAVAVSLMTTWETLPDAVKDEALDRLEVVLEIKTGYARGHAALARKGEPFWPFNDDRNSRTTRVKAMATRLAQEARTDRKRQRSAEASTGRSHVGGASARAIHGWVQAYEGGGLLALVDKRRTRTFGIFDTLDPAIRRHADRQISRLDGTRSTLTVDELVRRTALALRAEGLTELTIPDKTLRGYLSTQLRSIGRTTRSHTTNKLRGASSYTSYPALRPGQVVAIDVTRADNLVWDAMSSKVISVEIITALDVATRVVLALRVVPRSANAVDAGLILYDVLRPFAMAVSPGRVGDWRWAGVPERIGLLDDALIEAERLSGRPLVGEHLIPGLLPDAVRVDHGSIFTAVHFGELCRHLGIHLLFSRGRKPTDNAFVERWHETLQRGLLQVPGHKGRNPSERGSQVGRLTRNTRGDVTFLGDGALMTARELERHLREFIATDYHRTWHQGITIVEPGSTVDEAAIRLTPLETFDCLVQATGRIHVLQRPDLLYDFLPVVWATIQHDGVELRNLTYDCPALDEFRAIPDGFFRAGDRAAPFFRDPHDVSRIWFRHPTTDAIIEVPWRKRSQLQAPMTDVLTEAALRIVRQRGGNATLRPGTTQNEILEVLNDLGDLTRLRHDSQLSEWAIPEPVLISSHMRAQRSAHDHAEAQAAIHSRLSRRPSSPIHRDTTAPTNDAGAGFDLLGEWPDLGGA